MFYGTKIAEFVVGCVESETEITLAEINKRNDEIESNCSDSLKTKRAECDQDRGYALADEYRVGRYGHSGKHTHIVSVETVSAILDPAKASRNGARLGRIARVHPSCNGNTGGANGWVFGKLDTADVTCAKCRKLYGLND